jgi:pimeloyl-ACP methyl ester carboxylesterase
MVSRGRWRERPEDMNYSKILDHPILSQRYFFPRPDKIPSPFWVECAGCRLACAHHEIAEADFTVVHYHGNGEVVADYLGGFSDLISRMGCNCFLVEYPGYGGSSGAPRLGQMFADVQATIAAIRQPQNKLILFGRSVGSLFAMKAVELFPDVAGVILESAIADPLERLLLRVTPEELGTTTEGLTAAVHQTLNIRAIMAGFTKPTLILHTRHDGLVDVSHAERLARWCGGPVRLVIFPRGNHNDIMSANVHQYFALINEFVESLRA